MKGYEWQKKTYNLWAETGFKGMMYVKPSGGKTRGACMAIKDYLEVFGKSIIYICAPSDAILSQWESYLIEYSIDAELMTYFGALKKFNKGELCDLLILDECHAVNSEVQGKVLDFNVPHVLGLSGTPSGSDKKIGPIFLTVGWDEVNIAPTTIHYITFKPTYEEMENYNKWTRKAESFKAGNSWANFKNSPELQMIYFNRRRASYRMASRLPIALELIKYHQGERMMVFCELTKQVKDLSKLLSKNKIPHCVHITGKEELDKFKDGEFDIILSVKMVSEGFSDPSISCGIAVSSASSERSHIQEIGRIIRPNEGKVSNVYALIADGTTDDKIIKSNDFTKDNIIVLEWDEWKKSKEVD